MRITQTLILLSLLACVGFGQGDTYVISQQGFLSLFPLYQSWQVAGGIKFSETSGGLMLYTPLSREASVTLRGAGGSSNGDIAKLGGVGDAQIMFNYHAERANLIFSLGINLPSGKKKLTQEEFETSGILSAAIFHMQVPNFGMGFNVEPGVIWAIPVNDDVVVGIGATYRYKGKFQPLEEFGDYDPGDEILVTGGADIRLAEGTTMSADIVFTTYGRDKLDGAAVFTPGNKIAVNMQFRKQFHRSDLSLYGRYRSKGKSEFDIGGVLVPEDEKTDPDQVEVSGTYNMRLNDQVSLAILSEMRFHKETPAPFTGITLIGVGVAPTLKVSDNISVPARFKYLTGKTKDDKTLTGFEAGLGLRIDF